MEKEKKGGNGARFFSNLADFVCKAGQIFFRLCAVGVKQIPRKSFHFRSLVFNAFILCFAVAYRPPRLLSDFIQNHHWPRFIQRFLLLDVYWWHRFGFYTVVIAVVILAAFGFVQFVRQRNFQNKLDHARMGYEPNRPRVISVIVSADKKTKIRILSPGAGKDRYESKKDDLQAAFGQTIEMIYTDEGNPQIINITMSKIPLPKLIHFEEHSKDLKLEGDFIIGQSRQGFIVQNIADLPHLLIAGTTGSGKSVFFKQALLSLMQSTSGAKFYLMDFKRGVEFGCFSSIPDVQVIKTKSAALASLKSIKAEMQSRFDFLEKEKLTKLDPVQHNYPRIFVAIDEASELLALPDRLNPDKETIAEARRIINDIAKLGRAAAINLLIATQKVSKSIIDTALQENIGGRMAFRMATLANSTQVLGAKEASDLPEIPGRAIWNFGTKFLEVQVPYINEEELKIKVKQISQLRALSKGSSASGDEVSEAKRFSSKPSQSVVEELTE